MDEEDIQNLFRGLTQGASGEAGRAQEVLSILLQTTLRYRDALLTSEGIVLTVEDVRKTLQWLVPALATGELPQLGNTVRQGLLKIWLEELRPRPVSGDPQG